MSRSDLFSNLTSLLGLAAVANAALVGQAVSGPIQDAQEENGGVFMISVAGRSAGTITPSIIVGDEADLSDGVTLTGDFLLGGAAIDADGTYKIANQSMFRYFRLVLTGDGALAGVTAASALYVIEPQFTGSPNNL